MISKLKIIIIFILYANLPAQELSHSFYFGFANGTNVGGAFGVGTELFINKYISGSFSIGSIHPIFKEKVTESKFDFDIGLKLYPIKYLYFGINYGFLDYNYSEFGYSDGSHEIDYKETRGFSYTIGGRTSTYKNFYLSGFLGITNNESLNHGFRIIEDETVTPRMGILLGYCF